MTISGHRWNLECKPCCKDVKVQLDRLIFHKALSYFADSDHQPNEAIWTTPRASGLQPGEALPPGSVVAQTFRRQTWDWLELASRIVKRIFHWIAVFVVFRFLLFTRNATNLPNDFLECQTLRSHKRCFKHAQCVFNWWVQMFVARLLTAVQDNLIRDEIVLSSCQKAWRARREDWSWKWRRRLRWHRGSNPRKPALHRVPGWQNAWRVKEGTVKMMAQHRCQEGITLRVLGQSWNLPTVTRNSTWWLDAWKACVVSKLTILGWRSRRERWIISLSVTQEKLQVTTKITTLSTSNETRYDHSESCCSCRKKLFMHCCAGNTILLQQRSFEDNRLSMQQGLSNKLLRRRKNQHVDVSPRTRMSWRHAASCPRPSTRSGNSFTCLRTRKRLSATTPRLSKVKW